AAGGVGAPGSSAACRQSSACPGESRPSRPAGQGRDCRSPSRATAASAAAGSAAGRRSRGRSTPQAATTRAAKAIPCRSAVAQGVTPPNGRGAQSSRRASQPVRTRAEWRMMAPFFVSAESSLATAATVPWGEVMGWKVRVVLGILFLLAGSAKGQFLLFTPPGGPEGRPETTKERLEREISEAPHHLGPVRIAPLVGFRDVAYVRDLFADGTRTRSDVTATVGAGLRAYLH